MAWLTHWHISLDHKSAKILDLIFSESLEDLVQLIGINTLKFSKFWTMSVKIKKHKSWKVKDITFTSSRKENNWSMFIKLVVKKTKSNHIMMIFCYYKEVTLRNLQRTKAFSKILFLNLPQTLKIRLLR